MLNGWKTYIGCTLAAIPLAYAAFQAQAWGELATIAGGWLAAIGAAHKADKIASAGMGEAETPAPAAAAAILACLMLVGCAAAPATQNAKESAGRSKVDQSASTIQNDLRNLLPKQMKIESPGEVTFNFNFYGNERSSDISQTNSGSTTATQSASATQTPTSSTETTPSVTVPATGGP